jgi:hypothetical protein
MGFSGWRRTNALSEDYATEWRPAEKIIFVAPKIRPKRRKHFRTSLPIINTSHILKMEAG